MLLPPRILGFCVEQALPTAQKPGHLAKSVYAWVAVTMGGCKPNKGKERKRPEHKCHGGTIDTHVNRHPCKLSYTQHLPTCIHTIVAVAVKLRVLVRMAIDTYHAITAKEG